MAHFLKAVTNPQINTEYVMIVKGNFKNPHKAFYMGESNNNPIWQTYNDKGDLEEWSPKMENGQWLNLQGDPIVTYNALDFSISGH